MHMTATDPLAAAIARRVQAESDMPDVRDILRDIPIRRIAPKARKHSVPRKSYR